MGACPMWPNQSAHAQQPLIAMQRRAPNDLSALAACQLQTSSCGAFTFKGRDGAGCCCSWRTRPASGSLPRPAESDRFAWWVHPGALGSRTSGCGQILAKEAIAYRDQSTNSSFFGTSRPFPTYLHKGKGASDFKGPVQASAVRRTARDWPRPVRTRDLSPVVRTDPSSLDGQALIGVPPHPRLIARLAGGWAVYPLAQARRATDPPPLCRAPHAPLRVTKVAPGWEGVSSVAHGPPRARPPSLSGVDPPRGRPSSVGHSAPLITADLRSELPAACGGLSALQRLTIACAGERPPIRPLVVPHSSP